MGPRDLQGRKTVTCRSSIVGTYYRSPAEKSALYNSNKGDMLSLVRDPKNEFDGNAIKVFVKPEDMNRHFHVGFLSKSDAALYARAMDEAKLINIDAVMLDPLHKYPTIQFELPESAVTKAREELQAKDFE